MKISCCPAVACFCLGSAILFGQEFRATLTGRIIDPSEAPVSGAAVSIRNGDTNVAYSARSDSHGNYTAALLPPGSYSVTVTAQGFKVVKESGVQLTVAETATVDFKLEIGGVNQQVTVTAEVPVLESANGDRGLVVGSQEITEFPLNGRNPLMLAQLVPGVIYNGELIYQRPFDNGAIARWDISGSSGNNEYLLDGAPNNAQAGANNIAYVPPVDAVQEFKIQTNSYDAQYGKTGGGVINVALKSGGNRIHGTAYEFMRRNALDCNSFQNNAYGAAKGGHYLDQYGGEIDGPLYVPKIYDGRNRSFFLFTFEEYQEGTPQPLVLSTPGPEMRNGDFSKLVDGTGRSIAIYDPGTTRSVNGTYIRTPFPGNIIPSARIDPIARKIASYYPLPNTSTAGIQYAQQNLFVAGGANPEIDPFYNMVFKFDQNFGSRHRVFFREAANDRSALRDTNGIRDTVGSEGYFPHKRINDAYILDWVSTISPTMIVNARVSFSRYVESNDVAINEAFDMTQLGFPQSLAASLPYSPGFGRYVLNNYVGLGTSARNRNVTNTWAAAGSLTKVNGSHTTKAGFDVRWIQYVNQSPGVVFQLNENTVFTCANYANCDAQSGDSLAGFLLGTPSSGTVNYNAYFVYMQPYMAPWVQHDWKLTSRLTMNLGFRLDFNYPPNERFNRLNRGFDQQVLSPLDSMVNYAQNPNLPDPLRGGMLFAGVNGVSSRAANLDVDTWQPRVGLAYSLTPKTVLRGGWGRYYVNPSNNFQQSTGFNNQTTLSASPDGNRTTYPDVIDNPFPTINTPQGASAGLLTYVGRSFSFVNTDFRVPHTDLFSVGVQRAIGTRGRFEVTYSGSRGYDLESTKTFDVQGSGAFRDDCNPLLGHSTTYCNAGVNNPFKGLAPFIGTSWYTAGTISRNQILTPYPQFTGLTEYMLNTGRSWYNSLQSLYTVRMHNGISLNVNYTFSKNEARTGYLDPQNDVMQQGLVQYDRPHRFVASMVAQLPFGKGHRWLNSGNGFISRLVGGWEQTIMFNVMSGQPWALPSNVLYVQNADLPHGWSGSKIQVIKPCVAQQNDDGSIVMEGFSKDYGCTTYNFLIVNQTYNPRYTPYYDGSVRYQTIKMADVSLNKVTQINETFRFQIRAEVFNIANSFFVTQFSSGTQAIDNVPSDANFGVLYKSTVSAPQSNYPRQIQLGFKLLW
jgi:hypothetical protein